MTTPIGFVGLGAMGLPMAHNLLKAGYEVRVFNRTVSRAEGLAAHGAKVLASPRAIAEQTPIVLSIMADDAALEAVALGPDGILAGLTKDGVHVDMSTISPDTSKMLARRYRERGGHYISAPVFGRPEAAAAAKLWICPAGPSDIVERCRPFFTAMGQGIIVVGEEPHLANVLKLVGNFFVISAIETLSEAFTLAEKSGLKVDTVLEVVKALLPGPLFQGYGGRMARSEFMPPGFVLRLGLKDVGLMRKLAEQGSAPLPIADIMHEHLRAAAAKGRGELDWGAVITVVRELAGLEPGSTP